MSIKSGRYIITHAQHWNSAFLPDANDGTSLLGCLEQDVPGEEWNVKELRNGRYSIVNFGHKMSASAAFQAQKGEHVVGRETGSVWLIKEHGSEGKYTIATANDKLRWWLDDSWPETPITLHDAPPSDPRCLWTFQKIGRVNTTPYEAVKEEAEKAKAALVRTLAELEKAKQEAEEHKATFRSYFEMMSQTDTRQNTVSIILDYEQLRPIQVLLFWAAERGHDTAAQLILAQEGVDVNSKTTNGWTALYIAADNGHDAVVRLLLAQDGVDVNSKDTNDATPLSVAAQNGHDVVVRLLLAQKGVDVDSKDGNGWTPLSFAAWGGHDAVVRLLLAQKGVDVDSKDTNGQTPLWIAAQDGHDAVVRLLLAQKGVDVNSKATNGWTPLHAASYDGRDEVVRLLLKQEGVEVNVMDNTGTTALKWAEANKHNIVAQLLRERSW